MTAICMITPDKVQLPVLLPCHVITAERLQLCDGDLLYEQFRQTVFPARDVMEHDGLAYNLSVVCQLWCWQRPAVGV